MPKNYDVGYKKPPKHTQFQPGESGNPRGRPKGVKNLATDLEEESAETVVVTEGGRQKQTTKQRAMIKSVYAKALKGDTRAAGVLINLIIGLEHARQASSDGTVLSAEDQAILDRIKAQWAPPDEDTNESEG